MAVRSIQAISSNPWDSANPPLEANRPVGARLLPAQRRGSLAKHCGH